MTDSNPTAPEPNGLNPTDSQTIYPSRRAP